MNNYHEIVAALKAKFPQGTVQQRSDNYRPYIPNQVYTDRLEQATNSEWSKEIKELEINTEYRYVKAILSIQIGSFSRDGCGVAIINGDPAANPEQIVEAVNKAVNLAFKDVVDSYEMGWKDLAPYKQKDWGGNPALRHLLVEDPGEGSKVLQPYELTTHKCVKCQKQLMSAEWDLLGQIPNLNRQTLTYCFRDIPNHEKRKLSPAAISEFEERYKSYL
ncbi:hypothetical protein [Paenibacillus tepidiphilus]|uniref:hypothetical protein n=1 Tax=Paenibacillus tepidiphilus TaxID=2608683 RepID=UPI00123B6958|nr:hypothetical protein [Paenibacillus tepidiphilus]